MRGLPNHDQGPPPNAVMFDLDDTLVDHSSALRAGALALAEVAQITGDRTAFAARAVGMSAVWLDRSGEARLTDGTVRVSSLEELPALLCRVGIVESSKIN